MQMQRAFVFSAIQQVGIASVCWHNENLLEQRACWFYRKETIIAKTAIF
jgi:hypothetical protein